jgi:hypothetical protein
VCSKSTNSSSMPISDRYSFGGPSSYGVDAITSFSWAGVRMDFEYSVHRKILHARSCSGRGAMDIRLIIRLKTWSRPSGCLMSCIVRRRRVMPSAGDLRYEIISRAHKNIPSAPLISYATSSTLEKVLGRRFSSRSC